MKIVAVVLAGGSGTRSGFSRPKQLIKLGGRPLIAHALERFQSHPGVDEIAVVTSADCVDEIEALVNRERVTKVRRVLLGGSERHESSLSAIESYDEEASREPLSLLFHDAVRPLVSHKIISDVIAALDHYAAVDTAIPASDTVIFADVQTNTIENIPDRSTVRLGQTPQGFHHGVIKAAYARALEDRNFKTTDDCGVVLRYAPENRIYIVDGATTNLKLTYGDDLLVIDKFMQSGAGKRLSANSSPLALAQLKDKSIVVFGGTSGIGESITRLGAAYGARITVASRSGGVDIGDAASVEKALAEAAAEHGKIDAVINTAATLTRQPLATMSTDEIRDSVNTNFLGALNVARLSYDYLRQTRGHLMLFASSSYTYGRAFYSTYSASKAGVVNLTQALADEWSDENIKVNCVNPERSRTPMRTKAFGREPVESLLDPDEVARKSLGILISDTSGLIYDIIKT
ncbi:SDR family NAD(P)-dependent oxidoreductase [Glacieibacterium sp.]|uniref:SDR family NAD(P)-dependent oxidoreductase n=1 Tax=Glacieibacterium sp. TaxID=2860237 RepID=UPI003B00FA97